MLTWLAELPHLPGAFHLFRYLTFRTLGAAGTGLFLVFFFGPTIISALRLKQGKGQPIRIDGPASHILSKKGTPTMGGLMILFGLFVSALLWANLESPYVWIVLFVTIGFAAIGFYDDYLKVTKQSHLGFSGRARLVGEYVIAALACYAMMRVGANGATALALPFVNGFVFDFGWGFLLFGPFVIVAFGNAVNLTDGLDGLAIVPVMIAAATLGLIAYIAGNLLYSHYLLINHVPFAGDLMVVCGALIGAGVGFLWFNAPPAQIFMGDTGSLALGGLLGAIAVAIKHEIVLAMIGGLFVMEALSVVVQVASFKLTGKRVFRMAPIHHHFEQLGWSEPQIVMRFWIIAFVLAMIGLASLEAEVSMTPVETMRGQSVALFGLGGSGLSTARALVAGGAEVAAWDDSPAARERAAAAGFALVDLARGRLARFQAVRARARRAADPSRRRIGRSTLPMPRGFRSSATSSSSRANAALGAGCAVRRHHRHQRQIDDHRADRACAEEGRARRGDGRQHRRADSRPAAARGRAHACRRVLVLPDRPRALARAERRAPDQHHAGPSRPAWRSRPLRGDQGAARRALRRRAGRRRRRALPGNLRAPEGARRRAPGRCGLRERDLRSPTSGSASVA